jgi:hypothetical protein
VGIDVKKSEMKDVHNEIKSILSGAHGFIDVGAIGNMSARKIVNQLPSGTKHLQISGYAILEGSGPLLFGTCIDSCGKVLTKTTGSTTTSYQNVLMDTEVVLMSIMSCTYIFYKPLTESTDIDNLGVKKTGKCGKNSSRKKACTITKKREANTNTNNDSDSREEITIADLGKRMTKRGMKRNDEKKHK